MSRQSILRAALLVVALRAQTSPPVSGPAETFFALVLILVIIISIMAICARCKREQRSNQRSLEMSDRQSSYEPPVVEGERVPTPMGRVPASKLESRGAVV